MGKRGPQPDLERAKMIEILKDQGYSFSEIGAQLGVTKQAVWQMYTRYREGESA